MFIRVNLRLILLCDTEAKAATRRRTPNMFGDYATLIQLMSAAIASLAACASIYFSIRTRRDSLTQQRVEVLSLKHDFDSDLRKWAEEVSEQMTEAIFLCDLDPVELAKGEFFQKQHAICTRLSALIDRGRWFLPNIKENEKGQDKPGAYRGSRQPSLDYVVASFNFVTNLDCLEQTPNRELQSQLIETKKEFVTELQKLLDPREREKETRTLLNSVKNEAFFKRITARRFTG